MLKKLMVLTVLFSFVFTACSSDDNPTEPEQTAEPQEVVIKQINVPTAMEQNQNVDPQAAGLLAMANSVSLYGGLYSTPANVNLSGDNEWSGTWNDGSATYYWSSWEENGEYFVELSVTGSYEDYNVTDFLLVDLHAYNEGNSGILTIYSPDNEYFEYNWDTDSDGVYYLNYYAPDGSELSAVSNPDLSGEIEYYEFYDGGTVLVYRASWDSDGSGSWESWDVNGNSLGSGTW